MTFVIDFLLSSFIQNCTVESSPIGVIRRFLTISIDISCHIRVSTLLHKCFIIYFLILLGNFIYLFSVCRVAIATGVCYPVVFLLVNHYILPSSLQQIIMLTESIIPPDTVHSTSKWDRPIKGTTSSAQMSHYFNTSLCQVKDIVSLSHSEKTESDIVSCNKRCCSVLLGSSFKIPIANFMSSQHVFLNLYVPFFLSIFSLHYVY